MTRLKFHYLYLPALLAMMPGLWAIAADDSEQAERLTLLESAALKNPGSATAQAELADAYYKIYLTSEDPAYAELGIAQYRKFLSLQPAHDGAKLALYGLLYGKMLRSRNQELLDELRKMYGSMPEHIRTGVMSPSTMEAISLLVPPKDEPDSAVKIDRGKIESLLKSGIRESPRFSNTYFILGAHYRDMQEYDLEIAVLKQAAFMMPDDAVVQKNLGQAFGNKLDRMECYITEPYALDDAIQALQKVLSYAPDDAEAHMGLLRRYEMKGLYDLQLFQAKTLYKLTGSAADNELVANALVNTGSLQEAVDIYEAMRKKGSTRSSLKRRLGTAYFYQQNLEEAAKLLAAYAMEDSRNLYARLTYFTVKDAQGNRAKGQDSVQTFTDDRNNKFDRWTESLTNYFLGLVSEDKLRGYALNPCEQTEAYYYLGIDHLHKGDVAVARDYFNKVIELKVYGHQQYIGASYALKNMEKEPVPKGKRRKKR